MVPRMGHHQSHACCTATHLSLLQLHATTMAHHHAISVHVLLMSPMLM